MNNQQKIQLIEIKIKELKNMLDTQNKNINQHYTTLNQLTNQLNQIKNQVNYESNKKVPGTLNQIK